MSKETGETASILPTGIFNGTFQRLNLPIEAVIIKDGEEETMALRFDGTTEQIMGLLVDELVLLDVTMNMSVRSSVEKLQATSSELRDLYAAYDGAPDDYLDDLIAEVQDGAARLAEIVADHEKGFKS